MAYLLSLDPNKELDYVPEAFKPKTEDEKPTERNLFEALWICIKAIPPSGQELEAVMTLKSEVRSKSVEGGSIKLATCPCCGQRWMVHDKSIRTLEQRQDWILEEDVFNFLKACPSKWQVITAELQEYFLDLKKRFAKMESKSPEHWRKFLEDRDKPKLEETKKTDG